MRHSRDYGAASLLSIESDAKTVKGSKHGYLTGIVYLDPGYDESICPWAGSCKEGCLYYVFLIENREKGGVPAARTTEEIRENLRRQKQAARLEAYRDRLLRSGRIEIHEEGVPFRYVARAVPQEEPS